MSVAGRWFVTPHAIQRYRERIDSRATDAAALATLIAWSERSHRVREIAPGLELWRGPKQARARLRVATGGPGLPQLVTVIEACDRLVEQRRRREAREMPGLLSATVLPPVAPATSVAALAVEIGCSENTIRRRAVRDAPYRYAASKASGARRTGARWSAADLALVDGPEPPRVVAPLVGRTPRAVSIMRSRRRRVSVASRDA